MGLLTRLLSVYSLGSTSEVLKRGIKDRRRLGEV